MIDLIAFALYAAKLGGLEGAKQEWRAASESNKDTWRRLARLVVEEYGS